MKKRERGGERIVGRCGAYPIDCFQKTHSLKTFRHSSSFFKFLSYEYKVELQKLASIAAKEHLAVLGWEASQLKSVVRDKR